MPPFFSLAAVPLGLLDRVSPYLARIVWIALTWASIVLALDLIARLIYGKRLRLEEGESSLEITSPELLVPLSSSPSHSSSVNFRAASSQHDSLYFGALGAFFAGEWAECRRRHCHRRSGCDESNGHRLPPVLVVPETMARRFLDGDGHSAFFLQPRAHSRLGEVLEERCIVACGPSGKLGLRKRGAVRLCHVGSHFGVRVHSIHGPWNIHITAERRSRREAGLGDLVRRRGCSGRFRISRSAPSR